MIDSKIDSAQPVVAPSTSKSTTDSVESDFHEKLFNTSDESENRLEKQVDREFYEEPVGSMSFQDEVSVKPQTDVDKVQSAKTGAITTPGSQEEANEKNPVGKLIHQTFEKVTYSLSKSKQADKLWNEEFSELRGLSQEQGAIVDDQSQDKTFWELIGEKTTTAVEQTKLDTETLKHLPAKGMSKYISIPAGVVNDSLSLSDNVANIAAALEDRYAIPDSNQVFLDPKRDDLKLHWADKAATYLYHGGDFLIGGPSTKTLKGGMAQSAAALGWTYNGDQIKDTISEGLQNTVLSDYALVSKTYAEQELDSIGQQINNQKEVNDNYLQQIKEIDKAISDQTSEKKTDGQKHPSEEQKNDVEYLKYLRKHIEGQALASGKKIKGLEKDLATKNTDFQNLSAQYQDREGNLERYDQQLETLETELTFEAKRYQAIGEGALDAMIGAVDNLRRDSSTPDDVFNILNDSENKIGVSADDLGLSKERIAQLKDKYGAEGGKGDAGYLIEQVKDDLKQLRPPYPESDLDRVSTQIRDVKYKIMQQNVWDGEQIVVPERISTLQASEDLKHKTDELFHIKNDLESYFNTDEKYRDGGAKIERYSAELVNKKYLLGVEKERAEKIDKHELEDLIIDVEQSFRDNRSPEHYLALLEKGREFGLSAGYIEKMGDKYSTTEQTANEKQISYFDVDEASRQLKYLREFPHRNVERLESEIKGIENKLQVLGHKGEPEASDVADILGDIESSYEHNSKTEQHLRDSIDGYGSLLQQSLEKKEAIGEVLIKTHPETIKDEIEKKIEDFQNGLKNAPDKKAYFEEHNGVLNAEIERLESELQDAVNAKIACEAFFVDFKEKNRTGQ